MCTIAKKCEGTSTFLCTHLVNLEQKTFLSATKYDNASSLLSCICRQFVTGFATTDQILTTVEIQIRSHFILYIHSFFAVDITSTVLNIVCSCV